MKGIHLIMPMGGKGTRFFNDGYNIPKPLITINEKPFLFWATQSIKKYVRLQSLSFVVLKEHIENFKIDEEILKYFPTARVIVIPSVLNGAVLTCLNGVKNIDDDLPIVFNDCDHAFRCGSFYDFCNKNDSNIDGALITFKSRDPKFSYVECNSEGICSRTVEKVVISDNAICGAYYFKNRNLFEKYSEEYLVKCSYSEYFISGVYNCLMEQKNIVKHFTADWHLPFGTPEEYILAKDSNYFKELK